MNRLRFVLLPLLAGVLFATAGAQPTPTAPPATPAAPGAPRVPKAPKAPKAPRAPQPPDPWAGPMSAQLKEQLREGLAESIAEIESDDDIPAPIKARILKAMRKAHKSGDPRDLAELGDPSQWGADLSATIEAEINESLRKAGVSGDDSDSDSDDSADSDSADWDPRADAARAAADRARAAADRARAQSRANRDPWAPRPFDDSQDLASPFDDSQDFASPFDDPKLDWLGSIPYAQGALPGGGADLQIDLDLDLNDLRLDSGKLAELDRIASDEQSATAPAEREVKKLGRQLQQTVSGHNPNEAEVGRLVDAITAEEGRIRKARLSALIRTRKLLGH